MSQLFEKYGYYPDEQAISRKIEVLSKNVESVISPKVLMQCFSFMDITTLRPNDTPESVSKLVGKVNALKSEFPSYPCPASVCVYPNFASLVRDSRVDPALHVTTVASCFPSAQSFPEVKVRECELAVENGADEVDIVLALNSFLAGDYDSKDVLPLVIEMFDFIRDFEGDVPGAAPRNCGNYLDQNLGMAHYLAKKYLNVLQNATEENLVYPD